MKLLRPMHACSETLTLDRLDEISYPKYVSDKEDGIRCLLACSSDPYPALRAFSRKGIELPNMFIQEWAENGVAGLDGEIILPNNKFHDIMSFCMSEITLPKVFIYRVFDWHLKTANNATYLQRLQIIKAKLATYEPANTELIEVTQVNSPSELRYAFKDAVRRGKEGLIVRNGDSPYKHGRATWLQEYALKMKKLEDGEAQIIGFEEARGNRNKLQRDNFGLAKRSTHKAFKFEKDTLGALVCVTREGVEFKIGSGWDAALAKQIWENRKLWRGQWIIYTSHAHGVKEKPRQAIFKGLLHYKLKVGTLVARNAKLR